MKTSNYPVLSFLRSAVRLSLAEVWERELGALQPVFDDSTQSVHPVRPYAERRNDGNDGKDYL